MAAAALVALAIVWMYGRVLWGLVAEWVSSPDASYGLVLACVAAGVVWQRRHALRAATGRSASPGLPVAVLISGLLLFLAGQLGADLFLTRLSFIIVSVAAVWMLAGGRALRTLTAPIAFLAIAVPLPALVVNAITLPLQLVASRIAEGALAAGGLPVYRDGNLLMLPSATLEVAEACSGLRSLVSLVAIAGLLAWLMHGRLARRLLVIATAVPIAIVMNGLRIATTGVICETFGLRAVSGTAHEVMGWITFVVSVGLLAAIASAFDDVRGIGGQTEPTRLRGQLDAACPEIA
jgi:exosortase